MQQLTKTIIENAILIANFPVADETQLEDWFSKLSARLGLNLSKIELSADLLIATSMFNDELVFLHFSQITNDVWLTLAQHNEKTFFALYDSLQAKSIEVEPFYP
ncbi:hypothetical protein [Glaciecola sp. 1036]|uniref:hypothetical protein n=1 Tax=Alteromonadaceae TaxID=72275 RepID=UPI003CFF6E5C